MNSLSWLIYLGDVTQSLTAYLAFSGFILFFLGIGLTILSFLDSLGKAATIGGFCLMFTSIVFMFTAALLPTKNGVYMIAATQMNEDVLKNPKVDITNKTYNVINQYLDNQLKDKEKGQH